MGRRPAVCAACSTRPSPGKGGTAILTVSGRQHRVCTACIHQHGRTGLRDMLRGPPSPTSPPEPQVQPTSPADVPKTIREATERVEQLMPGYQRYATGIRSIRVRREGRGFLVKLSLTKGATPEAFLAAVESMPGFTTDQKQPAEEVPSTPPEPEPHGEEPAPPPTPPPPPPPAQPRRPAPLRTATRPRQLPQLSAGFIRDLKALHHEWQTPELVDREDEFNALALAFSDYRAGVGSNAALLVGRPGLGKTLLAERFAQSLHEEAATTGRRLKTIQVNCYSMTCADLVVTAIHRALDPGASLRGFSMAERLDCIRRLLPRRGIEPFIILDEADTLFQNDLDRVLFATTRLIGTPDARAGVLLVGQDFTAREVGDAALSTLGRGQLVRVGPYTSEALYEILRIRAGYALHPEAVTDEQLRTIALQSAKVGDARFGLEALRRAVALAAGRRADSLSNADIESALAGADSTNPRAAIRALNNVERRVFRAVLEATETGKATTGTVEKTYHANCDHDDVPAVAHTQFWRTLKRLRHMRLIEANLIGKGHAGTTQIIKVPETVRSAAADAVHGGLPAMEVVPHAG